MNEINIIELDQKRTNCTRCNEDTPLGFSIPMYEGKVVDITKTDEWAGMPVCKDCFYSINLVRGRVFGVRGNVRKAVVLKKNKIMITWSFLNSKEPGIDTIKAIANNSDWIGGIEPDYLQEVEMLKALGDAQDVGMLKSHDSALKSRGMK